MLTNNKKQKLLYVGHSGSIYATFFLPNYFYEEIDYVDWEADSAFLGQSQIKSTIFSLIESGDYSALVLHLDYDPFFYTSELAALRKFVKIIGIFGDDALIPSFSQAISHFCDLVLTTDPLELLKYKKLEIPSRLHLYDINEMRYPNLNLYRDIDILIYGKRSKGRLNQISAIKRNFKEKKVLDLTTSPVPFADLIHYLNRSRLTVNWCWTWDKPLVNNYRDFDMRASSQFKGRVFESLLTGCLPISTPLPAYTQIFGGNLPYFTDQTSLNESIEYFLGNEDKRTHILNLLTETAKSYLHQIQVDSPLEPRRERSIASSSVHLIDETVATYRMLDWLSGILRFRPGQSLRNRQQLRLMQVKWRFVFMFLASPLKFRLQKISNLIRHLFCS